MREYKLNRPAPAAQPRQEPATKAQNLSSDLVETFLRILRDQFYFAAKERLYFQERHLLIKAITLPANYLATRGMTSEIPADRYRQIIMEVIQTVKGHGTMADAHSPARYFWKVMQSHLQHHGDEYYEEAKRTRDSAENIALGILKRCKIAPRDSTISDLDSLHRLVKSPGGRRPAKAKQAPCTPPAAPQLDLFQ
jgi:hypothetical protein